MTSHEWMDGAPCFQDPDQWDNDQLPHRRAAAAVAAATLCWGCPSKAPCAEFAIKTGTRGMVIAGHPITARTVPHAERYAELYALLGRTPPAPDADAAAAA